MARGSEFDPSTYKKCQVWWLSLVIPEPRSQRNADSQGFLVSQLVQSNQQAPGPSEKSHIRLLNTQTQNDCNCMLKICTGSSHLKFQHAQGRAPQVLPLAEELATTEGYQGGENLYLQECGPERLPMLQQMVLHPRIQSSKQIQWIEGGEEHLKLGGKRG